MTQAIQYDGRESVPKENPAVPSPVDGQVLKGFINSHATSLPVRGFLAWA